MGFPLSFDRITVPVWAVALMVASALLALTPQTWLQPPGALDKDAPLEAALAPPPPLVVPADPFPSEPVNETPPAAPPPQTVVVTQPPKYDIDFDFSMRVFLSSTPAAPSPWTGTSPPFVLVQYVPTEYGPRAFNDTGMFHTAWISLDKYAGFDACDVDAIEFGQWHVMQEQRDLDQPLTYTGTPLPQDPWSLFGGGSNCHARAYATSAWHLHVCVETDGNLSKPAQEVDEVRNEIRVHSDIMDYCADVGFESPPQ